MKFIKYLIVGIVFGVTLTKSEVISWFRIYEMFKFQSFHMYGVIGSAVVLGIIFIQLIKWRKMKDIAGQEIQIEAKQFSMLWCYFSSNSICNTRDLCLWSNKG